MSIRLGSKTKRNISLPPATLGINKKKESGIEPIDLPVSGPFADLTPKTTEGLDDLVYTSGSHNLISSRRITPAYYNNIQLSGGAVLKANNLADACQFICANTLTVSGASGGVLSVKGDDGGSASNDGGGGGSGGSGGGGGGGMDSSFSSTGGSPGFGSDGNPGTAGDGGAGGSGGFGWANTNWVGDGSPLAYPNSLSSGAPYGIAGDGNGGSDFAGGDGGGSGAGIFVGAFNSFQQTGAGRLKINVSGGNSSAVGGLDGVAMIGFKNYDGSTIDIEGGGGDGTIQLYQILSDGTWILRAEANSGFGATIGGRSWGSFAGENLPTFTSPLFTGTVPIEGLPSLINKTGSSNPATGLRRATPGKYRDIILTNGSTLYSSVPDLCQFYWADNVYLAEGAYITCNGDSAFASGGLDGDAGASGAGGGGGGGGADTGSASTGGAGGATGFDGEAGTDGDQGAGGTPGQGFGTNWTTDGFTYPPTSGGGGPGYGGTPGQGGMAGGGSGGLIAIVCNNFIIDQYTASSNLICSGGQNGDGSYADSGTVVIYAKHFIGDNMTINATYKVYKINDNGTVTEKTLSDIW